MKPIIRVFIPSISLINTVMIMKASLQASWNLFFERFTEVVAWLNFLLSHATKWSRCKVIDLVNSYKSRRKRLEVEPQDIAALLLETIKDVTGLTDIKPDQDGDIGVGCGCAVTYLRAIDDGKQVHLFSTVVHDLTESAHLIERLNAINANTTAMQFTFIAEAIYAELKVATDPYDSQQIAKTFKQFGEVADAMGMLFQGEFGGKTAIAKSMLTVMRH
jgi:hypothetical protein